jgi:hypothetical protein
MSTTVVVDDELEEEDVEDYDPYYNGSSNDVFENLYDKIDHVLKELIRHGTELSTTANTNNNSFVNDINKSNIMDNNQPSQDPKNTNTNSITKCQKEAEESAALAMLRPFHHNSASSESTTGPEAAAAGTSSTATTTTSGEEGQVEDLLNASAPQTLEEAMNHLNRLKAMHDDLLVERERNNKFVERYQEKVAKSERMATLHQLIPRELFVREDRYQQELEHVYKWSGISDQEIADIYLAKLKKSGLKQHGASTVMKQNRDPYAGFRDVPNFLDPTNGKGSNGHSSSYYNNSSSINDLTRSLSFMRKIAGV